MKAAAYNAAAGDGRPPSIAILGQSVERFGARAVLGRDTLSAGEIMRMNYCKNVEFAYHSRARADNWAQWAKDNPDLAHVLGEAERLANG